jgi:hypothetical protein
MDGTGPQHPLSDSQLDRELESALGVEASPEFLARVRTRVAAEPGAALWRLATQRWSFEPLVGLAVIGVVLAVVIPQLMRDDDIRTTAPIVAAVAPTPVEADLQVGLPEEEPFAVVPARARQREARAVNELPLRLSTPLFSEEDRRVFAQYFAAVEEGRLPPRPPDTQVSESVGVEQALNIEPLVIDPLPLLAARVQAKGEGKW